MDQSHLLQPVSQLKASYWCTGVFTTLNDDDSAVGYTLEQGFRGGLKWRHNWLEDEGGVFRMSPYFQLEFRFFHFFWGFLHFIAVHPALMHVKKAKNDLEMEVCKT